MRKIIDKIWLVIGWIFISVVAVGFLYVLTHSGSSSDGSYEDPYENPYATDADFR